MIGQEFRNALRMGNPLYGTLLTSTSPKSFDVVLSLHLDFVFLCAEHVSYNPETLSWMCRAFKAADINPVVRILEPSPYLATQALDAGAGAILVPYVEDVEEVLALVGAVKYRPLKGKKLARILHGEEKPTEELSQYLQKHNRNNSLLLNIESESAVKNLANLAQILSLDGPGVDGFVIGPHDLSTSYNMPEDYRSADFMNLTIALIQQAKSLGVAVGGHTGYRGSLDLQKDWVKAGANIILHCSDMLLFADKLQSDLNELRKIQGAEQITQMNSESI
ncbi:HpcH/HpaI aldolase family protein [Aquirufa aurantiipilula]|uniref:Aldolase/citrate lyase family protein n=1 Tax=Aquirufa aurantiipilula TaxID=2696561 RepID=A0ABT6BKY6_9BACT|nr:aldolase/citrate lyase family protein [Aquirufa aurantiipilula]MBZ1326362.1 aldolase [Aquirufa aurantiipilula]MDF5689458.1 aldolase/citrate lyase family protein [Aquirufa aurantiipilula]